MNTTIAAAPAMSATAVKNMWAVVDRNGQVVVLFGGDDAEAEARTWRARGYCIARLAD